MFRSRLSVCLDTDEKSYSSYVALAKTRHLMIGSMTGLASIHIHLLFSCLQPRPSTYTIRRNRSEKICRFVLSCPAINRMPIRDARSGFRPVQIEPEPFPATQTRNLPLINHIGKIQR